MALDVESIYANNDYTKEIHAVSEALQFRDPFCDSIAELPWIITKNNYFLFNGQLYIQANGTSMGQDWVPHYADIYMAKCIRIPFNRNIHFKKSRSLKTY